MNIVRPLEAFHDSQAIPEPNTVPAPDSMFSLPAAAFVDAWSRALGLSDRDMTAADRDTLIEAIRAGTSRLKIIDALRVRHGSSSRPGNQSAANDIRRTPDRFVLVESLTRFAPEDEAAFLRYTFQQVCARDPSPTERLELEFDLLRKRLDRKAVVKRVCAIARREGHLALWDSLEPEDDRSDPSCARTMPTGLVYDENGRETLIFVREMPGGSWMVAPDIMRQPMKIDQGRWLVDDGWLLVGPKRSIGPSRWKIDLDLVQPHDAMLEIDVVANSGLDTLQRLEIVGPFSGNFVVRFDREHRFTELRMQVRDRSATSNWLKPRNISMQRLP